MSKKILVLVFFVAVVVLITSLPPIAMIPIWADDSMAVPYAVSYDVLTEDDTPLDPSEPTAAGLYQVGGNWSSLKRKWNTLTLEIKTADGKPVTSAQVNVTYDMVGMPMTVPPRPIVEKGNGIYTKEVFPGMRGSWKFTTEVIKDTQADTHIKTQEIN